MGAMHNIIPEEGSKRIRLEEAARILSVPLLDAERLARARLIGGALYQGALVFVDLDALKEAARLAGVGLFNPARKRHDMLYRRGRLARSRARGMVWQK